MLRRLLTPAGKEIYDKLDDDTRWWRIGEYTIWIETREVRPIPDDVEYSYAMVDRMMTEGLWEYEPNDAELCLWVSNGSRFLDHHRSRERRKAKDQPHISFWDRRILWPRVKRRIRREMKDGELRAYRELRGQNSTNGFD